MNESPRITAIRASRKKHLEIAANVIAPMDRTNIEGKSSHFKKRIYGRYKIGVVVATTIERRAVRRALDNVQSLRSPKRQQGYRYEHGEVMSLETGKTVPVVFSQSLRMSNNHSSSLTTQMITLFPTIRDVILAGIAGAVPKTESEKEDIWLGDVIVSHRQGVTQYDQLKSFEGRQKSRDESPKPSPDLGGVADLLISKSDTADPPWGALDGQNQSIWECFLDRCCVGSACRPKASADPLSKSRAYTRVQPDLPKVHFGNIGSGNTLVRDAEIRDEIAGEFSVIALEMEASGVADASWALGKRYFVIKSASDYCDDTKNDAWHEYAASTSAAFMRLILSYY